MGVKSVPYLRVVGVVGVNGLTPFYVRMYVLVCSSFTKRVMRNPYYPYYQQVEGGFHPHYALYYAPTTTSPTAAHHPTRRTPSWNSFGCNSMPRYAAR